MVLGHSGLLPVYESSFAKMPISLFIKIAKNINRQYSMNYQMDFDQICVKLMLSVKVKAHCRCDVAFRGILVCTTRHYKSLTDNCIKLTML